MITIFLISVWFALAVPFGILLLLLRRQKPWALALTEDLLPNTYKQKERDMKVKKPSRSKKQSMKWEPIETAPKDGTWVYLYGGKCDGDEVENINRQVVGQYTNYLNGRTTKWHWQFAWCDGGYCGRYINPTHWMPLFDPPIL